MSRFTANQQAVIAAPAEADVEQARDFVDALRGDDGQMITEMRLSDGYVSATKMCQSAGKFWADYKDATPHRNFMNALANSMDRPIDLLVQSVVTGPNNQRGTWVHPQLAINLASWCSPTFAVKVTELVLRYLSGQVTTEESRAAARTVNERAAAPAEGDEEEVRALKRQRVQHEIELDKKKHANEMAKYANEMVQHTKEKVTVQSELLDTLAAAAPPALTGMVNIARHNLAFKCLAVMDNSGTTTSGFTATSTGLMTQAAAAARRVTVQEFGRDILHLRGDRLSTSRLSNVGGKLARTWKDQPGKGEIVGVDSDTGEKQWKRTFLEDGATQTAIFGGSLDESMLANNRIKFSGAYLGTNEIGNGQAYDVWTYQLDQVDSLMRQAFQES